MTIQCCKCNKVRNELGGGQDSEWSHRSQRRHEPVSHTYCPDCLEEAVEEMNRERHVHVSFGASATEMA